MNSAQLAGSNGLRRNGHGFSPLGGRIGIADYMLEDESNGWTVLNECRRLQPDARVAMTSGILMDYARLQLAARNLP